ncbi:MAG: hypothetical protein JWO13_1012 [Acidobacteriales bacterium]|nr:hypothetical protein [Terriglobales bacterium]
MGGASVGEFPFKEELHVGLGAVRVGSDGEFLGGGIDPAGRAFDLSDVADGSFVEDYVTFAVGPFGAEFLVSESRGEAEGVEDGIELLAVGDLSVGFGAGLVASGGAFGLVRDRPCVSVLADAEDLAALSEGGVREIVERVELVGAARLYAKAGGAEFAREGGQVIDAEFDFDFLQSGYQSELRH